ncbi:hypothetical protein [Dickeya ananatis]
MLGSLTVVTLAAAVWRPMTYPPVNDAPVIVRDAESEKNANTDPEPGSESPSQRTPG